MWGQDVRDYQGLDALWVHGSWERNSKAEVIEIQITKPIIEFSETTKLKLIHIFIISYIRSIWPYHKAKWWHFYHWAMDPIPEAYELIKKRQVWGSDKRWLHHFPFESKKNWGSSTTRSFLGRLDAGVVVFGYSLLGVSLGSISIIHFRNPFQSLGFGISRAVSSSPCLFARPLWRTGSMFLRLEADEKANLHLYTQNRKKGFNELMI